LGVRLQVFLVVLNEIIQVFRHHPAELIGEIFQRPLSFELHVFRASGGSRNDESIESRGGKHGRRADFVRICRIALIVRQIDEGVDAVPEFWAGRAVAHDVYRGLSDGLGVVAPGVKGIAAGEAL
jgi:hypothetical protein